MRKSLALLILIAAVGCGRIDGEVARGRSGSATPATRVNVMIFADADGYFDYCKVVGDAAEAARQVRNRFDDSVYRATRTTPDGPSQADMRVTANLRGLAYGDAAKDIVTRRDSTLRAMTPPRLAWSGQTDLNGRFSSKRLPPGEYVVEVGGIPETAKVGLFGVESVAMTYYGIEGAAGCPVTPGR